MALSKEQRASLPIRGERLLKQVKVFPLDVRLYDADINQGAVMVPKRVEKKANKRNLIKRQCFSVIQKAFKEKHLGIVLVRVYSKPETQSNITNVMNECIELLRC